jgi:hypothetical protein
MTPSNHALAFGTERERNTQNIFPQKDKKKKKPSPAGENDC